jgi:hypothetical protein
VRTHVLAFRRSDLALLWDAFVAYGAGLHDPSVAPAGTLGARRGRLYLSTNTGLHACLDGRTGEMLWALRYRTPEEAPTPRLARAADQTMAPVSWYACPPAFSGDLVAFAPRDSYALDFVHLRPLRGTAPSYADAGRLRELEHRRPRLDAEAMTALWVLGGPRGTFLLAGQTAGREAAPLLQRDLDPAAAEGVPWRAALEESTVTGLPAAAAGAIFAATEKALYRVPFPGDGGARVLAALGAPPGDAAERPSPGNLTVAGGWVISAHEDGILAFGPPEAGK